MDNTLNIDVSTPLKELINKLDSYKPDIIMTYPATFQHLAFLKRKGFGQNIKPKRGRKKYNFIGYEDAISRRIENSN